VPLNHADVDFRLAGQNAPQRRQGIERLVGNVIKFPEEGRIVRFGRDTSESATIIILPVIRVERYAEPHAEEAEPHPPASNGGRRRVRRR
jgi:hypothetical protein